LIEPGYTVMKSWKKNGGLFFDQVILKSDSHFKARILRHIAIPSRTVIVPLPQRFERSWRLGRSPALAFSQMLQRETGIEIRTDLLMLRSSFSRKPRQAELRLEQRIQTPSPFVASENAIELAESRKIDSILLTDDFMTSGHTLKCAAMALKTAGFPAVHAIVLGYRPRPVVRQEESRSIPLQLPNP
jgi:predicted amidophosphoribosyltransferase